MSDRDVRAVLQRARERLSEPDRWTQRVRFHAVTAEGHPVEWWLPEAASWTLYGALAVEIYGRATRRRWPSLRRLERAVSEHLRTAIPDHPTQILTYLVDWNDDPARTHAEVLALLDRAIAQVAATEGEEG